MKPLWPVWGRIIAERIELTDDLILCHVTVRPSDGVVSVQPLLDTPVGTAIVDGELYKRIGQVREGVWSELDPRTKITRKRKGFLWYYDEEEWGRESGHAKTKVLAVAAILDAGGYVLAPVNAVNQGLW